MASPHQKRYLTIWLPQLPLDRVMRQREGKSWLSVEPTSTPMAVIIFERNAWRLKVLNRAARLSGLKPGMGVGDARGICPSLKAIEMDEAGERLTLKNLALAIERYSPLVALDPPDGLFVEVAGSAHLFRGEGGLLEDLARRLKASGFQHRAAIASTPAAGWGLAHYGQNGFIENGLEIALAPLPLTALRLDAETLSLLSRLGFKTVSDVMNAPRAPLAKRFGEGLLDRLDMAFGAKGEAFDFHRPPPLIMREERFFDPLSLPEHILQVAERLAGRIAPELIEKGAGGRRFRFQLLRVDGRVSEIEAASSLPTSESGFITRLFKEKLEGLNEPLDAGFGFDIIRLAVLEWQILTIRQKGLAEEDAGEGEIIALLDRLKARLGPNAVRRFHSSESHLPERAVRLVAGDAAYISNMPPLTRPIRLLTSPEPIDATAEIPDGPPIHFRWRKVLYRVARAEGPERIAAEWWRDGRGARTRDYYRVEEEDGRRFWLYREGLYERETNQPRWFLHGFLP